LAERLPDWRYRVPTGGLSLWCELPSAPRDAGAIALVTEAERQGVAISPGPVFAADGGLGRFVRIPYARPEPELRDAVDRLAEAWSVVLTDRPRPGARRTRVMVA
jgi:DNA-binding transcriptional MocR family regulator